MFVLGIDLADGPDEAAIACPACRLKRLQCGYMLAVVGAQLMALDKAPKQVTWPLKCVTCGYYEPFGIPANPLPVPLAQTVQTK